MPKRGSRSLAKKASSGTRKKQSSPNVFVADARAELETTAAARNATPSEPAAPEAVTDPARAARPTRPPARARAVRGQQVRARSEVFTHYLPQELRKIGILTAGVFAILIVLTVFLG